MRRIDAACGDVLNPVEVNRYSLTSPHHRLTEQIVQNDGTEAGMWMTATNKSYDFAFTRDHTGTPGRFHHVTYALDSREEILRAADM